MRKFTFLFLLFIFSNFLLAQTEVVENFEDPTDSTYWSYVHADNSDTTVVKADISYQSANAVDGTALSLDWTAQNSEGWGGFVKIERILPGAELFDWSNFDTISFWYYNETPSSLPGRVHLRFNLYEASEVDDTTSNPNSMEFYYSFHYSVIDDSSSQWQKISIPLEADPNFWGGEGFNRTGWAGIPGNDELNKDKIKGFTFEFSINGAGEGDFASGKIIFDQLELSGLAGKSMVYFNGAAIPANVNLSDPWGGNGFEVTDEEAFAAGTNSIKWSTTPNDWATWSGANFTMNTIANYKYHWATDSIKLAIKAPTDFGDLKLVFLDDVVDTTDIMFEAGYILAAADVGYTGDWQEISVPLRDFNRFDGGWDGSGIAPGEMDSTRIKEFRILLADANSFNKVVYLDNVWVGNPEFDVVPPVAPTGAAAISGNYQNLITWIDVPNEDLEVYNVYYSSNVITSVDDPGLEVVKMGVESGTQIATHLLMSPTSDKSLTYHYAVECVDAAGNKSDLVPIAAVTNTAKGVTAIHPTAPINFVADGNFDEWASIPEFRMFPSDGSGTIVNNTTIDGDADLSLDAYIAVDENYLYFAFDVEDDIIVTDTTKPSYLIDSPDLYIGLYDWHGPSHTAYRGGDEPDYHFRFGVNGIIYDNLGAMILVRPTSDDYYWAPKFPTGYAVEGRISFDDLVAADGHSRFVPVTGMRIPIDFSVNDADATGEREGILTYSIINQDRSWADVSHWTYTWIGDQMTNIGNDPLTVNSYGLSQNYPNPFNPSTVINYSLAKAGMVSLKIYNILGQEVLTLINTNQNVGKYQVKFDASQLSTGLYIYRIQSGDFVDTKKMMLLK